MKFSKYPLCILPRFMYWMSVMNSSLVFDYRIERAHLDGNQRTTIVTNIGLVIGFTIDVNDKRLYWSVIGKESVGSADLDGEFNPFMPNGIPHHYHLEQSISALRDVGWYHFLFNF